MKDVILIMDEDPSYTKKFCNQAIRNFGKKYIFLTFTNIKSLKDYALKNEVEALIVSKSLYENNEDIKSNTVYILNESNKQSYKEGKKTYVYKLQNVQKILNMVDEDIEKKYISRTKNSYSKLVLFYAPIYIKNKLEIVKKFAQSINKKKKTLIVDLDEFDNYKSSIGLSNLIFNYKENTLTNETIKREVITEKNQDFIKSVTYPEDFDVITNIDIANIIQEIKNLPYDFIFVNADQSYLKTEYIFNDADIIVLFKDKKELDEKFNAYIKNDRQLNMLITTEIDISKLDKNYINTFCKNVFLENNG